MAESVMQEKVLIEKILARLPVKSLIRFTIVCKYWQSVIKSPEFASKHYAARLSLSPHGCDSLLSVDKPSVSISVRPYNDHTSETRFKFRPAVDYRPPYLGIHHCDVIKDFFIYGPCNGLFVIRLVRPGRGFGYVFLLWNPATREVHKIPCPYLTSYHFPFSFGCMGFGFDPVTNDYKLVCFDTSLSDTKVVILYSLAKNSWKRLDGALDQIGANMYMARYNDSASSCNARLSHWVLTRTDGGGYEPATRYTLLSFDMVDEVFVQTPVPPLDLDTTTHPWYYAGFLSNHMYPALCFKVNNIDFDQDATGMHYLCLPLPKMYDPTKGLGFWDKPSIKLPDQLLNHLYESPEDNKFIGYTESLVSIANIASHAPKRLPGSIFVPPTIPHEVDDDDDFVYGGHIYDHYIYDMHFGDDDYDDDNPVTKKTFLVPQGPSFREFNTVYKSYEEDLKFHTLRKFEWLSLCELPYCLREVNQPMKSNDHNLLVKDVFVNGSWDCSSLAISLPDHVSNTIMCLPRLSLTSPSPSSHFVTHGLFSLTKAYHYLLPDQLSFPQLEHIWNHFTTPTIKIFLWLLWWDKLPHNKTLATRKILPTASCDICSDAIEDGNHILVECSASRKIWESFPSYSFQATTLHEWLFENLKCNLTVNNLPWNVMFPFLCYEIWKNRNSFTIAKKELPPPRVTIKKASQLAWEFYTAGHARPATVSPPVLGWTPPPVNVVQIDVDASFVKKGMDSGVGGVARDSTGSWILGFKKKICVYDVLAAELCAIKEGIHLAAEKLGGEISICTDSTHAVAYIYDTHIPKDFYHNLVSECRELLHVHCHIQVKHIPRGRNRVADRLAREARKDDVAFNYMYYLYEVPPSCYDVFMDDCNNSIT